MRKQYYFGDGPNGLRAWDVHRLIELAEELPVLHIALSTIRELDEPCWYGHGTIPTCRSVAEHAKLIDEADLSFPLILSSDGRVMDGMQRVVKALMHNVNQLPAKKFARDPDPDYIGVDPEDLPY